MTETYLDSSILLSLLTGDDPKKQQCAQRLFERVERREVNVTTPLTVIADVVSVLSSPSLYHLPRTEVVALLAPLLRLPNFRIRPRSIILRALEIYATHNVDFNAAILYTSMQQAQVKEIYSFDAGWDALEGLARQEPK